MTLSTQVLAAALTLVAGPLSAQTATTICALQGTTGTPAMLGARVTTRGIVTASFVEAGLGGFFLQEPGCDGDPRSSDGVWVDVGTRRVAVVEGHRVAVSGRVANPFGQTTIYLDALTDEGPSPMSFEPERLDLPSDPARAASYLEAREGMLVALPPSRVIAATNHFGEAFLAPEASRITRLYRGDTDGRKLALTYPGAWLSLDHGDRVSGVLGPLAYTFGVFKVFLTPPRPVTIARSGTSPPAAGPAAAGTLTLATYNLENLFDPIDDPGKDDIETTPTPAQYAVELARRAASIARFLGLPDVLAVEEVEKLEVLQDLAAQPELTGAGYRAVLIEGLDGRGIDVGLLYRSDRLWLSSTEARQGCSPTPPAGGIRVACPLPGGGPGFALFARPPLVVRLEAPDGSERLTVVVNHFKSQDSDGADERTRLAMAEHVRGLVDELKATDPAAAVVVVGDLNDFEDSPTLARLTAGGGLVDLHARAGAPRPYTYVFQGLSQVLDYILVEPGLVPRVVEAGPVHVNVDYGHPGPDARAGTSQHASDHDPVRVVLRWR